MEKEKDTVGASVHGDGGRPPLGSKPLLVYDHGFDPNGRQTAVSIADMSVHTHVVPELMENNFHVTPHGWVFLNGLGSLRARLWDPRSGESLALPDLEHDLPVSWKCYLSDVPTALSCVVLLLDMDEPKFLYCRVAGDTHWTTHEYDVGDMNLPPSYAPPTRRVIQQAGAVGGKFYILEKGKLGVIDFSPAPEFSYHDYTPPEPVDGSGCCRSHVAASGGELFEVRIYHKGFTPEVLTVRVYKFDGLAGPTAATLREVADLGDKVLLLSDSNQLVLESASKYGLKGNRIYFMHNVLEEPDGTSSTWITKAWTQCVLAKTI